MIKYTVWETLLKFFDVHARISLHN